MWNYSQSPNWPITGTLHLVTQQFGSLRKGTTSSSPPPWSPFLAKVWGGKHHNHRAIHTRLCAPPPARLVSTKDCVGFSDILSIIIMEPFNGICYDDSDLFNQENRSDAPQEKNNNKRSLWNITSLFKCNELQLILNYKRHLEAPSRMKPGILPRHLIDFSDYKIQAAENSENIDLARARRGSSQGL